jgi:predicted nucleotidyltransferase
MSRFYGIEEKRTMQPTQRQSAHKLIDQMVSRIVEQFRPERVILFGSYARGEAGRDSDVDLLVVMPVSGSKRAKQVEVRLALHDIRLPKDIIVVTPAEFKRHQDIVGTIVRPAVKEGKVLYAKH